MEKGMLYGNIQAVDNLIGSLSSLFEISGRITSTTTLSGQVSIPTGFESYGGNYEVTPRIDAQTVGVKNKVMTNDFVVKGIPCYEVSNQKGTTFIIGGTVNGKE